MSIHIDIGSFNAILYICSTCLRQCCWQVAKGLHRLSVELDDAAVV